MEAIANVPLEEAAESDVGIVAAINAARERGAMAKRTEENYLCTLRRLKAQCSAPEAEGGSSYRTLLMRPGVTYGRLLDRVATYKTLEVTLAHILGIMKHVGLKETPQFRLWRGAYDMIKADTQASRDAGEPTPRQQRGHLDWVQVLAKNEELRRTKDPSDMEALLSAMYTDIPPRRQADYFRVFLLCKPEDEARAVREPAHVDLLSTPARLHVRQFKTARHMGAYETELPSTLEAQIRASLEKKPREYLFVQVNGEPFRRVASFTEYHNRFLKKTFGDGVSNNSLRHAKATHLNSQGSVTLGQRREVAQAMGHGVEMNLAYSLQPLQAFPALRAAKA